MVNEPPQALEPVAAPVLYEMMANLPVVARQGSHLPAQADEPEIFEGSARQLYRALRQRFAGAAQTWVTSLAWRLIALSDLTASGALAEWVMDEGEGVAIVPDEVIEVAATLPLRLGQPFNAVEFLAALAGNSTTTDGA